MRSAPYSEKLNLVQVNLLPQKSFYTRIVEMPPEKQLFERIQA